MRRLLACLTGLATLALPGTAHGGRIDFRTTVTVGGSEHGLLYIAAPAEANRVTVARDGTDLVIHDDGATLAAGGCTQRDPSTAACSAAGIDYVGLSGGDGNDVLATTDIRTIFEGGPGDDVLDGGPAPDRLYGAAGVDTVRGGGGDDMLSNAGPEADALDGGAGVDLLTFSGAPAPAAVDLAAGTSARGDRIYGIENLMGSDGADVLVGDAGANEIKGGRGADTIAGGDGDDRLDGGDQSNRFTRLSPNGDDRLAGEGGNDVLRDTAGANTLDGGSGDDEIFAFSHAADGVLCGDGRDILHEGLIGSDEDPFGPDALAGDCELMTIGDPLRPAYALDPSPTVSRAGVAKLRLACGPELPVCRLIVGIGLAARPFHPLARRLVRIVGRETARFALARRAARRLRSAGRAELTVRDCSFCTPVVWTVALWPRSGVAKHT